MSLPRKFTKEEINEYFSTSFNGIAEMFYIKAEILRAKSGLNCIRPHIKEEVEQLIKDAE